MGRGWDTGLRRLGKEERGKEWVVFFNKYLIKTFNSWQKASIYIYNTCIYTYMHVCICTRTDVFVTMLECNVKSRLVALRLQRLLVRCTRPWSRCHLHLQWLYSRRGRVSPPLASNHYHHHHHPCIGLLKSLMSFPCVSKADWLRKSGRGSTSSGFGILHWLVFLQSLLLCWIY